MCCQIRRFNWLILSLFNDIYTTAWFDVVLNGETVRLQNITQPSVFTNFLYKVKLPATACQNVSLKSTTKCFFISFVQIMSMWPTHAIPWSTSVYASLLHWQLFVKLAFSLVLHKRALQRKMHIDSTVSGSVKDVKN